MSLDPGSLPNERDVNDTTGEAARLYRSLLMARSGEERFIMGALALRPLPSRRTFRA